MGTRRNAKLKSFGERLYEWRMEHNVTLEQAGDLLGVWPSTVLRWEKARVDPNDRLQRKAERLIAAGAPPEPVGARR